YPRIRHLRASSFVASRHPFPPSLTNTFSSSSPCNYPELHLHHHLPCFYNFLLLPATRYSRNTHYSISSYKKPSRVSKRKAAEVVENTLNGSPDSEGERAADVVLAIRKGNRTRKIAEPKTKAKTAAKVAKTIKISKATSIETTAAERTSTATTKAAKKIIEKAKPASPKAAPVSK